MRGIVIFLISIFSFLNVTKAQYRNLLQVQDAKEVMLFKDKKVVKVIKYQLKDNQRKEIYTAYYDTFGRLITKRQGLSHKAFRYDAKNRLLEYSDTTDIPDEKTWITYDFLYNNPKGLLSFYRGFAPSGFEYFPDINMLKENQLAENGAYFMRYYYYDKQMRLTKAYHTTPYKDTEKVEIIDYHKNTNLIKKVVEVVNKPRLGIDTSITIRNYDAKNNLISVKNISLIYKYNYYDTTFKTFIKESDTNSYIYQYDTLNRKLKEYYQTTDSKYNYSYTYLYNKDNLITDEVFEDAGKTRKIINKFDYFDSKGNLINKPIIIKKPAPAKLKLKNSGQKKSTPIKNNKRGK